jgi:hypothetical protein
MWGMRVRVRECDYACVSVLRTTKLTEPITNRPPHTRPGRYVATSVNATHQMENGFNIWTFNGRLLYQ